MSKSSNRFTVFIFNLVIMLIAAAALLTYALQPFLKINTTVHFTKEQFAKLLPEDQAELDLETILTEPVHVNLTLEIKPDKLFETLGIAVKHVINEGNFDIAHDQTALELVEGLIEENVDTATKQITPALFDILTHITKNRAKTEAESLLKELAPDLTDEKLEEIGFHDKLDTLVDHIQDENATVDGITQEAMTMFDEVTADLELTVSTEKRTQLEEDIKTILEAIATEDGHINLHDAVTEIIAKGLQNATDTENEEQTSTAPLNKNVLLSAEVNSPEETEEDEFAELNATVKARIMEFVTEDVLAIVGNALLLMALTLILSIISWVYVVIKIIAKMLTPNNAVTLKAPVLVGGLPGLLFWLIPSLGAYMLRINPQTFVGLLSEGMIAMLSETISLSVLTSGWVGLLGAIALFLISIPYRPLRNDLYDSMLFEDVDLK